MSASSYEARQPSSSISINIEPSNLCVEFLLNFKGLGIINRQRGFYKHHRNTWLVGFAFSCGEE